MQIRLTALTLVVALVLAGCGADDATSPADAEEEVREAAAQFIDAIAEDDPARACATLTAAERERVATSLSQFAGGEDTCEQALGRMLDVAEATRAFESFGDAADALRSGDEASVTVDGPRANVSVTLEGSVREVSLIEEDGAWLVDDYGKVIFLEP